MDQLENDLKQRSWLNFYREKPSRRYACERANVSRETLDEWEKDESFAREMHFAAEDAADRIDERLYDIASGMDRKLKFDRNDNPVMVVDPNTGAQVQAYEVYRSDAITMLVARALRPEKYADKVDFDLSNLSNEQLDDMRKSLSRERVKKK